MPKKKFKVRSNSRAAPKPSARRTGGLPQFLVVVVVVVVVIATVARSHPCRLGLATDLDGLLDYDNDNDNRSAQRH